MSKNPSRSWNPWREARRQQGRGRPGCGDENANPTEDGERILDASCSSRSGGSGRVLFTRFGGLSDAAPLLRTLDASLGTPAAGPSKDLRSRTHRSSVAHRPCRQSPCPCSSDGPDPEADPWRNSGDSRESHRGGRKFTRFEPQWRKSVATLRNGSAGMYGTVTKRGGIEVGRTLFLETPIPRCA